MLFTFTILLASTMAGNLSGQDALMVLLDKELLKIQDDYGKKEQSSLFHGYARSRYQIKHTAILFRNTDITASVARPYCHLRNEDRELQDRQYIVPDDAGIDR